MLKRRSGLSLIECVIIIAIAVIIIGILWPCFIGNKHMARRSSCNLDLKELLRAYLMYQSDYGTPVDFEGYNLENSIKPYLGNGDFFTCPSDNSEEAGLRRNQNSVAVSYSSYGWNSLTLRQGSPGKMLVQRSNEIPLIVDSTSTRVDKVWEANNYSPVDFRHKDNTSNVAFFDGHVKYYSKASIAAITTDWTGGWEPIKPALAEAPEKPNFKDFSDGIYVFKVKDGKLKKLAGPLE